MRELIYFVASLAGSAVLTAIAVLVRLPVFWKGVLYVAGSVLALCALWLLIDFLAEAGMGKKIGLDQPLWLRGLIGAVAGAIIWMGITTMHSKAQDGNLPKAGDILGSWGAGAPRSGEMPKAGDTLGGIGFGAPSQSLPQYAPSPAPSASADSTTAPGSSTYSIGNVYDNRGGIIQQGPNNVINQAPVPELHGISSATTANPDGTYTHTYLVEWTAEFPGDWRISAYSKSILAINISANQTGWSGNRPDYAFTTVSRPNGRYTIAVRTSSNDPVELRNELIK